MSEPVCIFKGIFYVGSKNGSELASPWSKKSENLASWIIFQSGPIGGVPWGPWALKNIKKSSFFKNLLIRSRG